MVKPRPRPVIIMVAHTVRRLGQVQATNAMKTEPIATPMKPIASTGFTPCLSMSLPDIIAPTPLPTPSSAMK